MHTRLVTISFLVTCVSVFRPIHSIEPIFGSSVQDPNWYKARREDGLEGMVPANFLQEAQPMAQKKVYLQKME